MAEQKSAEQAPQPTQENGAQATPAPVTQGGKKKGGKKKVIIIVVVVLLALIIGGAAAGGNKNNSGGAGDSSSTTAATKADKNSRYTVTIDGARTATEYGKKIIIVTYTFTNNSDKETSFTVAISDKAYQNGVQLSSAISSSADNQKTLNDIQPGVTLTLEEAYQLDDSSEVTVKCTDWSNFSSDNLLAERTFSVD